MDRGDPVRASRSVAFAPQDGQAANFEVFMLPAMTAAVLLARARARPRLRASRSRSPRSRSRPARPRCCRSSTSLWQARGQRGRRRAALGVRDPDRGRRAARRARRAPVLGRARQRLLLRPRKTRPRTCSALFALMTFAFIACNLPILWTIPTRVARPRGCARRRPTRHRPVALARSRPRCRWRSGCASSATTTCSCSRRCACSPRARWCSAAAASRDAARSRSRSPSAVGFSVVGFVARPWGDEPKYQRVSEYLEQPPPQDRPRLRLGPRARDLLGVGPLPGDAASSRTGS